MATLISLFPRSSLLASRHPPPPISRTPICRPGSPILRLSSSRRRRLLVLVSSSSAASFDELDSRHRSSKKSILTNLIIEPLDLSRIQQDVPANTVDAMKKTISGMLGLLPSDQFSVLVEAYWDPLFKLLLSSIMTGYTLSNAEYRLCLERNLDVCEDLYGKQKLDTTELDTHGIELDSTPSISEFSGRYKLLPDIVSCEEAPMLENLGDITPEVQEYILHLKSQLSSMQKELHDLRRKRSAVQMQQFVGEEKKDLLDYLRSLQPEKVAEISEPTIPVVQEIVQSVVHGLLATLSQNMQLTELSEPTTPVVQEIVQSVVHGLLATPSQKMNPNPPPQSDNTIGGTLNIGNDDCAELVENTFLQFHPLISVRRDHLARLLFWCMLLGHYLRGLEHRLELMQLLTIPGDVGCS